MFKPAIALALCLLAVVSHTQAQQCLPNAGAGVASTPCLFPSGPASHTDSNGKTFIRAGGASFPFPLYQEWFFAFQLVKPSLEINYDPVGSGCGRRRLFADNVEFAGSDSPLSSSEKTSNPQVKQFPFVGGPNVLVLNLKNVSSGNPLTLAFSRPTIAAIFNNTIYRWRDPLILADNPTVDPSHIPDANISVVIREDSSGTTNIQTSAFAKFGWGLTTGGVDAFTGTLGEKTWNNTQHGCRWFRAPQNFGVYAMTLLRANSIGYVSYAFVIGESVNIAKIINKAGVVQEKPDPVGIQKAIEGAHFAPDGSANINDLDDPDAWPMLGFTYIMINTTPDYTPERCARRRELGKLFNWLLSEDWPNTRAARSGFVMVPKVKKQELIDALNNISCPIVDPMDSTRLVSLGMASFTVRKQRQEGGQIAVFAISMVLFAASIILIAVSVYREWEKIPKPAVLFAIMMAVGAAIAYVAVILFFLVPYNSGICELRKWFTCLGFSLMLGAVFTKTMQINSIYRFAKRKTLNLSKGIRHMFIVSSSMLVVVAIQTLLLILWSSLDTWDATTVPVNSVELISEWACVSTTGRTTAWLIVEIVYFAALCLFGIYVVYQTWEMKYSVTESKWLLIAIYNCILTMALIIPLIALLKPADDGLFYFAGLAITFLTFTTIAGVYIPKFTAKPLAPSMTMSMTTSKGTGGGSASKNTNSSVAVQSTTDSD